MDTATRKESDNTMRSLSSGGFNSLDSFPSDHESIQDTFLYQMKSFINPLTEVRLISAEKLSPSVIYLMRDDKSSQVSSKFI